MSKQSSGMRFVGAACATALLLSVGAASAKGGKGAGKAAKAEKLQLEETPEPAPAKEEPAKEEAPKSGAPEGDAAGDEGDAAKDDAAKEEASGEGEAAASPGDDSPVEEPGVTYRFVGARYRGIILPKFMLNLFGDGGRTVYIHSFGPEFAIRKDGFEYNIGMWLGLYNMDDTAFKGSSDPDRAWEIINAKMQVLFLSSDFLWSHPFNPQLSLLYGAGAGFGIVFGDLHRNQAYPLTGAPGDPNSYKKCASLGFPNPAYCDNENKHYGNYLEPSWANGGSKPLLFPWLAVQTGIRYKVSRQFVGRFELGFGTSGFFFGLGADYGL